VHLTSVTSAVRRAALRFLPEVVLYGVWHNPLFDDAWYRRTYPDVGARRGGPEVHYRRHGVREGRDPNPVFRTRWYLQANPDVARSGLNPLDHYLLFGAAEGRDPGPAFSTRAYVQEHPEVARSGQNPLAHYLAAGMPGRTRPVLPAIPYPTHHEFPSRDGSHLRLLLVLHDAREHGAQQSALQLAGTLAERFDAWLDIVLLAEGGLRSEYEAVGRVHDFAHDYPTTEDRRAFLAELHAGGVDVAIANTTVTGSLASLLKEAGFRLTQLIHELPGIIHSYGLEPAAAEIAGHADRIVFASAFVQRGFESVAGGLGDRAIVRPQGLYRPPAARDRRPEARRAVRAELGIEQDRPIVLAVGYADERKGVDLFVDVCGRLSGTNRTGTHQTGASQAPVFVWLGCERPSVVRRMTERARSNGGPDDLRLLPRVEDVERYYAAADILLLPSREDPFPSVVLEAMAHGLPVVAFADATGASDVIARGGGTLVPYLDTDAMAAAVTSLLGDTNVLQRIAVESPAIVEREFAWLDYVYDLLAIAGLPRRRVSVVILNFNHERYLDARLTSVFGQTYPVREVLLLDDASTDGSRETVSRLAEKHQWDLRIVTNEHNSGSVFRQWLRGVGLARSELVWIAESDDVADPGFLAAAVPPFDDPAIVMSYTESRQIDGQGRLLGPDYRRYVDDLEPRRWNGSWTIGGGEALARWFAVRNPIPNVSAVVFRREPLARVLSRDIDEIARLRAAGDYLTYVRLLLEGGSLAFDATVLNDHRRDASSVTQQAYGARIVREIAAVQRVVDDRVDVSTDVRERAAAYLVTLVRQFDLPADLLQQEPPDALFPAELEPAAAQ
jgi:glycosyltransferase involved in cell wall biosynthesis